MSRIGKKPVQVPDKVKVAVADGKIAVEGPLGKLEFEYRPEMTVALEDDGKTIVVSRQDDERQNASCLVGVE